MAVSVYTGLMGSGKSYEIVDNVILSALASGRRVVTNVAGLDIDAIGDYLVEKRGADAGKIGEVTVVTHDQVLQAGFFPREASAKNPAVEGIVKGGDLVVLDEVWRFWPAGGKLTEEHMEFLRMHRHFINADTSGTCDIALIVQDIGDLNRFVKAVIETTFVMTKLKSLGLHKNYRVDVYSRAKLTKANKIRDVLRKYDPDVFALYKSYSQSSTGAGKEGVVDKRASIWGGALFRLGIPLMLLLSCASVYFVYRFFHRSPTPSQSASAVAVQNSPVAVPVASESGVSESSWRVKGHYNSDGHHIVVLVRDKTVRLLVDPAGFFFNGLFVNGTFENKEVSNFSGQDDSVKSTILGGKP